jgi:hypothetical protein
MVATGGGSNDYIGGAVPYTIQVYPAPDCASGLMLKGHSKPVTCLAFSPDGSRLVSGSWEKDLKLWDAATGKCVGTFKGQADRISCAAVSPDGSRLFRDGAHRADSQALAAFDAGLLVDDGKAIALLHDGAHGADASRRAGMVGRTALFVNLHRLLLKLDTCFEDSHPENLRP